MNKTINNNGFLPLTINHINFDTEALTNAVNSTAQSLNETKTAFILHGCVISGVGDDAVLSEGAIFYNGEIFQVDQQTFFNTSIVPIFYYSFDLVESFAENSQKQYLNGNTYETRKIRKAALVQSPTTFTETRYNTLSRNRISTVASDLATHKAKGGNHDYLRNPINEGNFTDVSLTPVTPASITSLETDDFNWFSGYYMIGDIVIYNFNIVLTLTDASLVNGFEFEMSEPFPRANGYAFCSFAPNSYFSNGRIIINQPTANLYANVISSRGNILENRIIRFSPCKNEDVLTGLTGEYVIFGTLTLKKLTSDKGY